MTHRPANPHPAWLLTTLPVALALLSAAPAVAATDPVTAAYNLAFANPTNVADQLAYAHAVEAAGKPEAAFPVYERVLALDPNNADAQAGLRRIRAIIEPARNDTFVELGAGYESNPLRVPSGANGEFQLFGNLEGTYERTVGEQRWRTVAQLNGVWHDEQSSLNYGYAGAFTGPLLDMGANATLHLGVGGGVSTFDGRLFYSQVLSETTYEWGMGGATQTLRLRAGWRQYDPFWVSNEGFWADLTGKFIAPQPAPGDAAVLTPWLRWSGVGGSFAADDGFGDEIDLTPGRYAEAGGQAEYVHQVSNRFSMSFSVSGNYRQYTSDVVPLTTTPRHDTTLSPGFSLIFPNVFTPNSDLRLRYNYVVNRSNDGAHSYTDNLVSLSLGTKF